MKGFKSFASETEIPFQNSMNVIVGPNGSGKSSCYDTRVLLSDGMEIEIGKLVEDKILASNSLKKLDDGIYTDSDNSTEIISLNIKTMKCEKKKISKFIKRKGDIVYKIKTRTGKEVKATGCHPVIAFKDGSIRSTTINELTKKDLIATPRILSLGNEKDYDVDLARLIGYIIGDGYIAKDRIEFINNDSEVIEDFKSIIVNKFKLDFRERLDKNIRRIYIRDKNFVAFIRNLFVKNCKDSITSSVKKVPDEMMNISKIGITNILQGLFDTDGSVRKDIGVIEYCTKNKNLADQIQGLLLRFGIISKIKKRACCASNTDKKLKRDYYYLYVYGKENIEKFYSNISLKVKHKRENIESYLAKNLNSNTNIDILPKEVNLMIKNLCSALGIKIKPLKKEYPFLLAYIENRCSPTRVGVGKLMPLFFEKFSKLQGFYSGIKLNQSYLVSSLKELNISGQEASKQIGLHPSIIMRDWATNKFKAKTQNLNKFYAFINNSLAERLGMAERIIVLLKTISQSDIFWDELVSVEVLGREEFVYDLEIEDNHNFIANNLFVHNSNIADAICFVLGRLSIKSMRAAKSANLIFAGTKEHKPASQASVRLVFDNLDKGFFLDNKEVIIERMVRNNGQSIYRIIDETKTRQDVLELLAQAGVDPHGFNIILQGEINDLVKSTPEERRKVIEQVAGISVYEIRKQKSLHELEKTDEKLKTASAVLRERTAYLKNLEQERQQALKFKQLEKLVKKCKASIINKKINEKKKELANLEQEINKKASLQQKLKSGLQQIQSQISDSEEKINQFNLKIQKSTGIEQEQLYSELTELRESLAGLEVHKQNSQRKLDEVLSRRQRAEQDIKKFESEIQELRKKSPMQAKKQEQLELKKQDFEALEQEKKKFYTIKSALSSIKERIDDKKLVLQKNKDETQFILNEMNKIADALHFKSAEQAKEKLHQQKKQLENKNSLLNKNQISLVELEKSISVFEAELSNLEKIKKQVSKLDICPLCKSKISKEHIQHVYSDCDEKIIFNTNNLKNSRSNLTQISKETSSLSSELKALESDISNLEIEIVKLDNIEQNSQTIKRLEKQKTELEQQVSSFIKEKEKLEKLAEKFKDVETKYEQTLLEIETISARTEENLDAELEFKQRDLETTKLIIKQSFRDQEELTQTQKELEKEIEEKSGLLEEKEAQEKLLQQKFKKLFEERTKIQDFIHELNSDSLKKQHELSLVEQEINNSRIDKARFDAEKETLEVDFETYEQEELMQASIEILQEKLVKTEETLRNIGSVNMRALEVYDSIKGEYDKVAEKVTTLENEKLEILKIMEEIDNKKKKTFNKTLRNINELFTRNFSQLSTKGLVFLNPETEEIFDSGLNIIVKVGKGKYFDVTSLSGGEQTLVGLSLLFAIQEYKPHCFYLFDEVDAALDKRNSERLATLIKRYMKTGQYIVITHNDAIITESSLLYGISMQDGISKILSLEV